MNPKEFLLHECRNVRSALREVLRHDYSAGSSKDFYTEFCERLDFLESLLKPVDPTDIRMLETFADEVSMLSMFVHQIERSHSGEFPWPFTEYLTELATPLCKENLTQNEGKPIIRVYAEGGLYSYKINLEADLSVLNVGRRIFTIVFPRTLKHHVLLHAIFGHEVGHAAWTIPKHNSDLRGKVLGPLRSAGPLTSTSQATHWLRNAEAPAEIEDLRKQYEAEPIYTDVDTTQLSYWFQEFMCDLFGLVTFGPSFIAAHKTLLLALDPTGHRWGPEHPPYISRRAMLWRACQHLGWNDYVKAVKDTQLRSDLQTFLETYLGSNAPGEWEDVFTSAQIATALDALKAILESVGCPPFALPDETTLLPLVRMLSDGIPPCGSDLSGSAKPANRKVDFRHILFGGWVVAEKPAAREPDGEEDEEEKDQFLQINKLCELGLLQQRAIDMHPAGKKE